MAPDPPAFPLLLQRVPDARRARAPLLPAIFLPYVALMLGSGVAAACALYNAIALRRMRLVVWAVVLGVLGWVGFNLVIGIVIRLGLSNVVLAVLPARLVNLGLGALLAWTQWAHVRGHTFLAGRTVPLLHAVLAAFALVLVLPVPAKLVLEGLWVLLLR